MYVLIFILGTLLGFLLACLFFSKKSKCFKNSTHEEKQKDVPDKSTRFGKPGAQLEVFLESMEEGVLSFDQKAHVQLLTDRCPIFLGEAASKHADFRLFGLNYARLAQELEERRERQLPFSFELETVFPEGFELPGQYEQQLQIMSNLIANAVFYNREGGFVRVSAGIERNLIFCRVEDNGPGIAKEDQERIFERFYRVEKDRSRNRGGTGLGLSIVKHMVQLLGGQIRLNSELGEGSSFVINYPLLSK